MYAGQDMHKAGMVDRSGSGGGCVAGRCAKVVMSGGSQGHVVGAARESEPWVVRRRGGISGSWAAHHLPAGGARPTLGGAAEDTCSSCVRPHRLQLLASASLISPPISTHPSYPRILRAHPLPPRRPVPVSGHPGEHKRLGSVHDFRHPPPLASGEAGPAAGVGWKRVGLDGRGRGCAAAPSVTDLRQRHATAAFHHPTVTT